MGAYTWLVELEYPSEATGMKRVNELAHMVYNDKQDMQS